MALPVDLKPNTKSNIMDLVARAGIDVLDWPNYKHGATNPGANPKYCYEWALKQPGEVVVCNLWFENMKDVDGHVEQHLVLADTPTKSETDPTRRARRGRMSELLAEAATEGLPVRVIVLDGNTRAASADGKTHVKFRKLDPETWSVTYADRTAAKYVLRRVLVPAKFVDQFDLKVPADGPLTNSLSVVTTRARSREVRKFALMRASGRCEYCGSPGFALADGRIYLETHHVVQLSLGGQDNVSNVVALCANHHREAHHGKDADLIKSNLQRKLRGDA